MKMYQFGTFLVVCAVLATALDGQDLNGDKAELAALGTADANAVEILEELEDYAHLGAELKPSLEEDVPEAHLVALGTKDNDDTEKTVLNNAQDSANTMGVKGNADNAGEVLNNAEDNAGEVFNNAEDNADNTAALDNTDRTMEQLAKDKN